MQTSNNHVKANLKGSASITIIITIQSNVLINKESVRFANQEQNGRQHVHHDRFQHSFHTTVLRKKLRLKGGHKSIMFNHLTKTRKPSKGTLCINLSILYIYHYVMDAPFVI